MQGSGSRHLVLGLCLLFVLALLPRLYSALTVGWSWDGPGTFQLVNFDEAGSCRAALQGFSYTPFVGWQTLALAEALGWGSPADIETQAQAVKAYCHSPQHLVVARAYSAALGAATAVVLVLLGLQLVPQQPRVAWTAGLLLALSGFHLAESHKATVDVASVFFIYLFFLVTVCGLRGRRRLLWLAPLLLIPAIWTKYWWFALFSFAAFLPGGCWQWLRQGLGMRQLALLLATVAAVFAVATNADFQRLAQPGWLALFYLLVPWRPLSPGARAMYFAVPLVAYGLSLWPQFAAYTTGPADSPFGTGYAAIGWHKLIRNVLNVPLVLLVGLGAPACWFALRSRRWWRGGDWDARLWLVLLPVAIYALYLLALMPVTYYRHYLPLLPAAALLAAIGLWCGGSRKRPGTLLLAGFFLWPAALAIDLVGDYHRDPRVALREWFVQASPSAVYFSYYVNPPPVAGLQLFHPQLLHSGLPLTARWLVLSENWYDTAFASELNGPLVSAPQRLVKTTPEQAAFYRQVVAGEYSGVRPVATFEVQNFMPELVLHKRWYGSFQMFVGDIRVFELAPPERTHSDTLPLIQHSIRSARGG